MYGRSINMNHNGMIDLLSTDTIVFLATGESVWFGGGGGLRFLSRVQNWLNRGWGGVLIGKIPIKSQSPIFFWGRGVSISLGDERFGIFDLESKTGKALKSHIFGRGQKVSVDPNTNF